MTPLVLIAAAAAALVIGIVLGMLGGGGAILTLPVLVYALGVEPKTAIATSLFVVGTTSIASVTTHARAGAVKWKLGLTFGLAAMAGAYVGGRLAHFVPANALLVAFGLVMVLTATAMLRPKKEAADGDERRPPHLLRAVLLGAGVGVLSGLVGAGGGFLIVPALTLFGGLKVREAIGTSLFVIALQSFSGFAGHAAHVDLDWTLVAVMSGAAAAGSVVGALAGRRVQPAALRRAFAWLVLAMGLFMFAKHLPLLVAVAASALTLVAVAVVSRSASALHAPRP